MKKKTSIKEKIVAWLKRDVTNNEVFALLFLILLGKSLIIPTVLFSVPLQTGIEGIELTEEQSEKMAATIYESVVGSFMENIHKINELGLSMKSKFVGRIIGACVSAIPYFIITAIITVCLCFLRMLLKITVLRNKNEKIK